MMDATSLVSAAEELADSPDPVDSRLAVLLCFLSTASEHERAPEDHDDLIRAANVVATAWQSSHSDGARLLALPVLDRVLLLATTGSVDIDARDLVEINRSRIEAGRPFWPEDD